MHYYIKGKDKITREKKQAERRTMRWKFLTGVFFTISRNISTFVFFKRKKNQYSKRGKDHKNKLIFSSRLGSRLVSFPPSKKMNLCLNSVEDWMIREKINSIFEPFFWGIFSAFGFVAGD